MRWAGMGMARCSSLEERATPRQRERARRRGGSGSSCAASMAAGGRERRRQGRGRRRQHASQPRPAGASGRVDGVTAVRAGCDRSHAGSRTAADDVASRPGRTTLHPPQDNATGDRRAGGRRCRHSAGAAPRLGCVEDYDHRRRQSIDSPGSTVSRISAAACRIADTPDQQSDLSDTLAPPSSSFFLIFSASSLAMFSLTGFGAPSTRSLASFEAQAGDLADHLDDVDLLGRVEARRGRP